jgi:hypothetical protein
MGEINLTFNSSATLPDGRSAIPTMSYEFDVSTPATKTITLQALVAGTNPLAWLSTTNTGLKIAVYYYPDSSQLAVTPDQQNNPWTAYTPTYNANFGTVTKNTAYWRRVGETMEIKAYATCGTAGAGASTITIPTGYTIDTTKIPQPSGYYTTVGTWFNQAPVVAGVCYSGAATLSPCNGAQLLNANAACSAGNPESSWTASIPIVGWTGTAPAPLLVGSVTSSSAGSTRVNSAYITNGGSCAVSTQSGDWIASVADTGTGLCAITLKAGAFTTAPACTCSGKASLRFCHLDGATSTTTINTVTTNGSAAGDYPFDIICMEPR